MTMTSLALQHDIGHELHLDGDDASTLTLLTTATLGIKREILGGEAHLLGQGLIGKEVANGIVGLDVGGRIRTGALANGVLIDELHVTDGVDVALETQELARSIVDIAQTTFEGRVEDTLDETRFARARNACDYRHDVEGNLDIDASEVVHAGALDIDVAIPGSTR